MPLTYKYRLIILCLIAFTATWLVFKPILKIAKDKHLTDDPNSRKLQKVPIPVLGGLAVFFGVIIGCSFYKTMVSHSTLMPVLSGMTIMLYVGAIDDILSIKPGWRLVFEFLTAGLILFGFKDVYIADFQGLFGIEFIPAWLGYGLSVLTFAAIINAINMIDGVDGLSSAFSILILGSLGVVCFIGRAYSFAALSAVMIGALMPFFLHNVFGYTTKMFIGDAGTMMVGTAISSMIVVVLCPGFSLEHFNINLDFNRIAFCLAVLSIPIADTLRVMFFRILHHRSPFSADKNHLHHHFVACGVSYIFTTISEVLLNLLVIALFFIVWALGASNEIQLITVVLSALSLDIGIAVCLHRKSSSQDYKESDFARFAAKTKIERKGVWRLLQKLVDGE